MSPVEDSRKGSEGKEYQKLGEEKQYRGWRRSSEVVEEGFVSTAGRMNSLNGQLSVIRSKRTLNVMVSRDRGVVNCSRQLPKTISAGQ